MFFLQGSRLHGAQEPFKQRGPCDCIAQVVVWSMLTPGGRKACSAPLVWQRKASSEHVATQCRQRSGYSSSKNSARNLGSMPGPDVIDAVLDEREGQRKKPSLAKVLQHGANPDSLSFEEPGKRRTLLCLSVEEALQLDEFDRVKVLLDAKADPNKASETGEWPLQLAAKSNHLHLCRLLLQYGADVNQQDEKLVSPLHMASFMGDARVLQLLLLHKANVNLVDRLGQTPLFFASTEDVLSALLDARADVLHLNRRGQSCIHLLAYSGYSDVVSRLSRSEDGSQLVDLQDEHGRTALHHAAVVGHQDVVARLLDAGADPRIKTLKGQTAMTLADSKEHIDLAYYIYTRVSGGNKSTWRESVQNPVFLTMAAIMGNLIPARLVTLFLSSRTERNPKKCPEIGHTSICSAGCGDNNFVFCSDSLGMMLSVAFDIGSRVGFGSTLLTVRSTLRKGQAKQQTRKEEEDLQGKTALGYPTQQSGKPDFEQRLRETDEQRKRTTQI
eukprot:6465340-Amphidinium_carterae.1